MTMRDTPPQRLELAMFDPVSAPEALGALIRSHVLFKSDPLQRQLLVDACVQAWNIGLSRSGPGRDMGLASADMSCPLPAMPAAASRMQGWTDLIHVLVEQRCQLFPHVRVPLRIAGWRSGSHEDELLLDVRDQQERILLAWNPGHGEVSAALPALVRLGTLFDQLPNDMHRWLQSAAAAPDVWATRAANRCNLLLLDLAAHRSTLAGLRAIGDDDARVPLEILQLDGVEEKVLTFIGNLNPARIRPHRQPA